MKIEYLHASKFGNGASVAEQFKKQMEQQKLDWQEMMKGFDTEREF